MRGEDTKQTAMFSYLSPEDRVPVDHPLRIIRDMVDPILERLSPRFAARYARGGRPSIPHFRTMGSPSCISGVVKRRDLYAKVLGPL